MMLLSDPPTVAILIKSNFNSVRAVVVHDLSYRWLNIFLSFSLLRFRSSSFTFIVLARTCSTCFTFVAFSSGRAGCTLITLGSSCAGRTSCTFYRLLVLLHLCGSGCASSALSPFVPAAPVAPRLRRCTLITFLVLLRWWLRLLSNFITFWSYCAGGSGCTQLRL